MAAAAAVNFEICDVDGDDSTVPPLFGHGHQASVGKVHRLIFVFSGEFADAGVVVRESPWADEKAVGNGGENRVRAGEQMGSLGEDWIAGGEGRGETGEEVFGPWAEGWLIASKRGDERAGVEEVDQGWRRARLIDRRTL